MSSEFFINGQNQSMQEFAKEQTIKSVQESVNAVLATASGIDIDCFHTDDLLNKCMRESSILSSVGMAN